MAPVVDLLGGDLLGVPNLSPTPLASAASAPNGDVALYLLKRLQSSGLCHWATPLLQPTLESLRGGWLGKALALEDGDKFAHSEFEVMAVLTQVPWHDLARLTVAEVQNFVRLSPLCLLPPCSLVTLVLRRCCCRCKRVWSS